MAKKTLSKKIKLAKVKKVRTAPRWADIKKFGLKRARTRRINVEKKRWRRTQVKV
jgi:ribosomal protein L39E